MGLNKPVNFSIAKLLKEKGFSNECEFFYSKHGSFNYLKPHREYEHLHSYSELLVQYFDGKYDWNSLNVDEGAIALKTAFSETDEYVNCECSAPTIAEVVMWLYEKHGIWISINLAKVGDFYYKIFKDNKEHQPSFLMQDYFDSPSEAYEAAIKHTLEHLLK